MTASFEFLPLEEIDLDPSRPVIIWLKKPSNIERPDTNRCDLVKIGSVKKFKKVEIRLREDLKSLVSFISEQSQEELDEILGQEEIEQKIFYNPEECLRFMRLHSENSVILILSPYHIEHEKTLSYFKRFPQISKSYCCKTEAQFQDMRTRWFSIRQYFQKHSLLKDSIATRITDLDDAGQLSLINILLIELMTNSTREDEGQDDFIDFYHSTYELKRSIRWYTKPSGFISRIISGAYTCLDPENLIKIRFYIRDLYRQLNELYKEQLESCFQDDLVVYRGAIMSTEQLSVLKSKKNLFVTRNFLSTSRMEDTAQFFAGNRPRHNNEVSVVICMHIKHSEIQDKPIAFIGHISFVSDEFEIILPTGLVFRPEFVEEVNENGNDFVRITMIRGEDEREIEQELRQISYMIQTGTGCSLLGLDKFLETTNNGKRLKQSIASLPRVSDIKNAPVLQQSLRMPNNIHVISCLNYNSKGNQIVHGFRCGVNRRILKSILLATFVVSIVLIDFSALFGVLHTAGILATATTTVCPQIVCSMVASVQNPSNNYQVEQLNLTCSQTLVNMSIVQTIQRTFNETHAQQYQTFWNASTNMSYSQTPTQLNYYWFSVPGMPIVNASFPHFVEAQYFYTGGSARNTSGDTWQLWLRSICGENRYFSGTY